MSEKWRKDVLAAIPQVQNYQLSPDLKLDVEIKAIAHEALDPLTFPKPGAALSEIVQLGYSFDGYAQYGMEACAKLANQALSRYYHQAVLPEDLSELRACLFFESRRWSLYQSLPDTKAMIYIFALIDKIKEKVSDIKALQ